MFRQCTNFSRIAAVKIGKSIYENSQINVGLSPQPYIELATTYNSLQGKAGVLIDNDNSIKTYTKVDYGDYSILDANQTITTLNIPQLDLQQLSLAGQDATEALVSHFDFSDIL